MKNGLGVRRRLALDMFSSIEDKRIAAHELRTIMWEATLRCNLACRHCGSDCRSEAAVPDMPAADFLRTIDTITPHVVPNRVLIVITGGEALMRRDIEEVGRAFTTGGIRGASSRTECCSTNAAWSRCFVPACIRLPSASTVRRNS